MVLDCTEVEIEKPKDLRSHILTYSHYKGTHTAKILVSEISGGLIYVSPAYGGKVSDTFVMKESRLLQKCISGVDAVMVGKGFLIDNLCEAHNIKMIRPLFLKGQRQLSEQAAQRNQSIASARVHIERAIQRMKLFKILRHRFPLDLIPYMDDIVAIIAGIVNLSKPLFPKDKFLSM